MPENIHIKGTVLDKETGKGVGNLKVIAHGTIKIRRGSGTVTTPHEFGSAVTKKGKFSIPAEEGYVKKLVGGSRGKIYFKVFDVHNIQVSDPNDETHWSPSSQKDVVLQVNIEQEQPKPKPPEDTPTYYVGGHILSSEKPLEMYDKGEGVKTIQDNLIKIGHSIPQSEIDEKLFGFGTTEAIRKLQDKYKIPPNGKLDSSTRSAVEREVSYIDTPKHRFEGRVFFENGESAKQVKLRLFSRGFGDNTVKFDEIVSDDEGFYAFSFQPDSKPLNYEVRAVNTAGDEFTLTNTKLANEKLDLLNLVVDRKFIGKNIEFEKIVEDLDKEINGFQNLKEAKENDERQDITYLHESTGWDARLIALSATAVKLQDETNIPMQAMYGALRAGLPMGSQQLARVKPEAFEKAINRVNKSNIIQLSDDEVAEAKQKFSDFSKSAQLATKTPGNISTIKDLISKSGVNMEVQNKFINVYFGRKYSSQELWDKVKDSGVDTDSINKLQLHGKLSYLTLNNAVLAEKLQQVVGEIGKLDGLVENDFYATNKWVDYIKEIAGNEEEQVKLIPSIFQGENVAEQLESYAADLARKVRLSFPTHVVGRMIEKNELKLGKNHDTIKSPVKKFISNAIKLDYEIGRIGLSEFINKNEVELFSGIANDKKEEVKAAVNTLQRVYQITPTNEAMATLLDLGFTSASEVVEYPLGVFIERFGHQFETTEEAKLVYRKSEQVSTVTYSFFNTAQQLDSAPTIYGISPTDTSIRNNAKNELIKHYPTMESLFGSLDFCECEHCRSVLSPAAYFVDLLQFLEPDNNVWTSTMQDWKFRHNNNEYMDSWVDSGANPIPTSEKKPYHALIERRPDLPHLPLTCENTHTALPYIDVVNEVLEYYVAHDGALASDAMHDTGKSTTPELLAEPHNILPAAYKKLNESLYPLGLPFDLWQESVRGLFDHFGTQLHEVLEIFRRSDDLLPPNVNPEPYYREQIFAESIGLSPSQYDLLTDNNPLAKWYELYGYTSEADALTASVDSDGQRTDLKSAKCLARKLNVTYKDLIKLVTTNFINPNLNKLALLKKIGLDIRDVVAYKNDQLTMEEKDEIEERFTKITDIYNPNADPAGFDAKKWLDDTWDANGFDNVLVLHDTSTACNFDDTELMYADSNQATSFDFLKINIFVRLWKIIGWSIEETDHALEVFIPKNTLPLTDQNIGDAIKSAIIYISHLKELNSKVKAGKNSLIKLLTFWSSISTSGIKSLYEELFLSPAMLKDDPVFDEPLGNYLSTGEDLKNHMLSIQGALNITATDIEIIIDDAGGDILTEKLTLQTVSKLYRYVLLSKALKIAIDDLIAIKNLSGLDPFKPLDKDILDDINNDFVFTNTIKFIGTITKIRELDFKIEDIRYLLRHHYDPVGKYREKPNSSLALFDLLSTGLNQIQNDNTVLEPVIIDEELLNQKIGLVFKSAIAEEFIAMISNTIEYEVLEENVAENDKLDSTLFEAESAFISIIYDKIKHEQRLRYRGVLIPTERARLDNDYGSPLLLKLLLKIEKKAKVFFDSNLLKHQVDGQNTVGFLDAADLGQLFGNVLTPIEKKVKLINAFFPYVQDKLSQKFITDTILDSFNTDSQRDKALLTDGKIISSPYNPGQSLVKAFYAAKELGVDVAYYAGNDGTGNVLNEETLPTVDTNNKPAGTKSIKFKGLLQVPISGAYRFHATVDKQDVKVEFRLDNFDEPVLLGKATQDNDDISNHIELEAGLLYHFVFSVHDLTAGDVKLLVQGEELSKSALNTLILHPSTSFDRVEKTRVLFEKNIILFNGLSMSEREVRYIRQHAADFNNIDYSKLPKQISDDSIVKAKALFSQFMRLVDYTKLRNEMAGGQDDLINIFESARQTFQGDFDAAQAKNEVLEQLYQNIADLTRRQISTVKEASEHLQYLAVDNIVNNNLNVEVKGFSSEKTVGRLWDALKITEKLGISITSIVSATSIVDNSKTSEERYHIEKDLKNTVKAKYEVENWNRIAQPIFDHLRQQKRNALVDYIMHQHGFKRPEQLFEYFLIDTGMEPVVQTSRLQLAIASIQLFIQRSLLNLEKHVHPSLINSKQWQWMKRYRVWEANRKIFLYPENWLEPEFRDDKTHLFQELESALLEGDVSNDLAEGAFFNYLKKLEELANLKIVALYCEEKPLDPDSNTLHVIGRTYNIPHKYFYRRYANQMWSPWEPVTTEIQSDHVVAVIWKERLHLFWLTFVEKSREQQSDRSSSISDLADNKTMFDLTKKQVEIQLSWCEYYQGDWKTPETNGFATPIIVYVTNSFTSDSVKINVSKEYEDGLESAVNINLGFGFVTRSFRVVNKYSPPKTTYVERKLKRILKNEIEDIIDDSRGALREWERELKYTLYDTLVKKIHCLSEEQIYKFILTEVERTAIKYDVIRTEEYEELIRYLSKNRTKLNLLSEIEKVSYSIRTKPPYLLSDYKATQYNGKNKFEVEYAGIIESVDDNLPECGLVTEHILKKLEEFSITPCGNPLTQFGTSGVGALVSPLFYQDDKNSFFIEPSLSETTIDKWEEWIIPLSPPENEFDDDKWWKEIPLDVYVPEGRIPFPPVLEEFGQDKPYDPRVRYKMGNQLDWLINPTVQVKYGDRLINESGSNTTIEIGKSQTSSTEKNISLSDVNIIGDSGLNSHILNNISLSENLDEKSSFVGGNNIYK